MGGVGEWNFLPADQHQSDSHFLEQHVRGWDVMEELSAEYSVQARTNKAVRSPDWVFIIGCRGITITISVSLAILICYFFPSVLELNVWPKY